VLTFKRSVESLIYIKRVIYIEGDRFLGKILHKDHYIIMGDNKMYSKDSRHFGSISKERIMGKAVCVIFSLDSGNKPYDKRF